MAVVPPGGIADPPSWRSRKMRGALFDVICRKSTGADSVVEQGVTLEVAESVAALLRELGSECFIRPTPLEVHA